FSIPEGDTPSFFFNSPKAIKKTVFLFFFLKTLPRARFFSPLVSTGRHSENSRKLYQSVSAKEKLLAWSSPYRESSDTVSREVSRSLPFILTRSGAFPPSSA